MNKKASAYSLSNWCSELRRHQRAETRFSLKKGPGPVRCSAVHWMLALGSWQKRRHRGGPGRGAKGLGANLRLLKRGGLGHRPPGRWGEAARSRHGHHVNNPDRRLGWGETLVPPVHYKAGNRERRGVVSKRQLQRQLCPWTSACQMPGQGRQYQ